MVVMEVPEVQMVEILLLRTTELGCDALPLGAFHRTQPEGGSVELRNRLFYFTEGSFFSRVAREIFDR